MPKGNQATNKESQSALDTGQDRFLAQAITHALDDGWRTAEDFLRHFKPLEIMTCLEKAPDLRASLLVAAAGVHEKIARKKSTSSASEDLRIALDERVTTPADVLAMLPPEARVRYFDKGKLWVFLTEDEFWTATGKNERAADRLTFMLKTALSEKLVSLQDIADGITFETISSRLPHGELQKVVLHALKTGRGKSALSEESLLEVVSLRDIVGYIPLEHTYKRVIVSKVAEPAGFVAAPPAAPAGAPPSEEGWDASGPRAVAKPEAKSETKADKKAQAKAAADEPEENEVSDVELESAPPPPPADEASAKRSAPPPKPVREAADAPAADDVDALLQSPRSGPEEEARRRVTDRLRAINRLPPRHADLSNAILLSIESMYADLLSASNDEGRESAIRESFPNEQQMAAALLAMIELLDPTIDVNDPVIKDADVDSLIKVVMFEERHRYEQAHPSMRPSPPPPPGPPSRRSVAPPPLPRPR